MRHIKESIDRVKNQNCSALPFGLEYLDDYLGGLYPGEMTVICGDADDGKTALMIRQIHRLAFDEEIPVLIILNGMSEHTFLACMAAFYCSIITNDVHQVYTDSDCKEEVEAYWHLLERKPVFLADTKDISAMDSDSIKQFVSAKGIKVVFFEQASVMTIKGWKISRLGYYLKQLAKELQVAIVAEYEFWYNDYEQPLSLQQFEKDHFSNFADNIIGLLDFSNHQVFMDEKGNNIRGYIRMKIIKHKGIVSSGRERVFHKMRLMCRSNEHATLYEDKMASNDGVKAFMGGLNSEDNPPEGDGNLF
jgi:hypothetical protein